MSMNASKSDHKYTIVEHRDEDISDPKERQE